MRETEASGWIARNSSSALTRALRFNMIAVNLIAVGVALAMTAGAARAADDDDEKAFSDKVIDSIKTTIRGGANIDDGTIQYRERSPLVVPPKLDLPPPDTATNQAKAPNWPKDPDEGRRRTAKKKEKPGILDAVLNPFLPTKPGEVASAVPDEPTGPPPPPRPGNATDRDNPVFDQAGSLFKSDTISSLGLGNYSLFGGTKTETVPFKGEPTRESLTQPPPGYQTPSANFAYGVGMKTEVPKPMDTNSAGERVR